MPARDSDRGDDSGTVRLPIDEASSPDDDRPLVPDLPIGTRLGNHVVREVIGRGGMGTIYGAEDTQLGRPVAIKVLPGAATTGSRAVDRFLQEARAAARLRHPNVVTIHEIGRHEGHVYLVMEALPGGSMADACREGLLPWREATEAIAQACRGLEAAHRAGLIHRDVKPANLLRDEDGTVKVSDFGLAKLVDGLGSHLTQTGKVLGTPAFMSPEQCQAEAVDLRTDIYALGATYYALLTGKAPFDDSTSGPKVMFAHCYGPVPDPRQLVAGVPAACAAIVRRAMAKAPADRYPDAAAMRAALESALRGDGVPLDSATEPDSAPMAAGPARPSPERSMERTAWALAPTAPPAALPSRRAILGGAAAVAGAAMLGAGGLWLVSGSRGGGRDDRGAAVGAAPSPAEPIRVGLLFVDSGPLVNTEQGRAGGPWWPSTRSTRPAASSVGSSSRCRPSACPARSSSRPRPVG